MDIKWEDPPERNARAKKRYDELFATLASRPGQWALVGTFEKDSTAGNRGSLLRRLAKEQGKGHAYEFRVTKANVYGRMIPPTDASDAPAAT